MSDQQARSGGPQRRSHRVAQWATGNIGTRALQQVIDHPDLELVGLFVYNADKAGRDAGELCGRSPTGVLATVDIAEIIAAQPDCVVYMPRRTDLDEVCALLAAGINVVSTGGLFHHPPSMNPETRVRVEEACRAGGTTIHATGSSPGFITEAVPLVLSSIQRRLDQISIQEFADLTQRNSPELLFDIMGFGTPPAELDPGRLLHAESSFGPSLRTVAEALSIPLDDLVPFGELALAPHDVTIAAGTIVKGTVAGQRIGVEGIHNGRAVLRFQANWYCSLELDPHWDLMATGWRVTIDGDAPLEVDLRFPFSMDEMADRTPGYTANRAVNAVPFVCAAEPGIRTITELPPIVPVLDA